MMTRVMSYFVGAKLMVFVLVPFCLMQLLRAQAAFPLHGGVIGVFL